MMSWVQHCQTNEFTNSQKRVNKRDHETFYFDMKEANMTLLPRFVSQYNWCGPAVLVDDAVIVAYFTRIQCQIEAVGDKWAVFPIAYASPYPDHPLKEKF